MREAQTNAYDRQGQSRPAGDKSYRVRRRLGVFVMFMGVAALIVTFLGWQFANVPDASTEFAVPFLGAIAGVFIGAMMAVVLLVFLNPWFEEEDWK